MARPDVAGGNYDTFGGPGSPVEDAPGAFGESVFTEDYDIDGTATVTDLGFKFNAPLHRLARHVRPDLGSDSPGDTYGQVYDETRNKYGARADDAISGKFNDLRLGRISMSDEAMGWAVLEADSRFGFRFLYNPESVQHNVVVGKDFIPNPQNRLSLVLQSGLETISFELLLNRIPDVNGPATRSDYEPNISETTLKEIKRRGTHYDLDFLYRVANGVQDTQVRKGTGDLGVLLPNPCNLFLGRKKTWGALSSVQSTDKLFSKDMVPTLTYVTLTFVRYFASNPEETEAVLRQAGVVFTSTGEDDSSSSSSSSSGSSSGTATNYTDGGPLVQNLDQEQSSIARHICDVAMANFGQYGKRAALCGLITARQESGLRNLKYGDRDSQGVFQQRPASGWGSVAEITNVQYSTSAFFGVPPAGRVGTGGLKSVVGWETMDIVAASHQVQRSAYPEAPRQWIPSMTKVRDEIIDG